MTNQYVPDLAQLGPGDIARSQDVNDRYENTVTGFDRLPAPKNGEQGFSAPVPVGAPVNSDHAATKDFVETGVTSQVVIAQGHANDANASKIAAANSETAAAASESVALSQSGIATTKASEALASQIAAAISASAALSSQNSAATSESNASASEAAAAGSESAAQVYQTISQNNSAASEGFKNNAISAADTALIQAGIATTKANEASASEANAATSETNAAASETNAATSETNAAASVASISGSVSAAATSEANAAASETAAAASAAQAALDETAAQTHAGNAQTSANLAVAAMESLRGIYLGPQSSDPTLDLTGAAVTAGDWYFSTTLNETRIYSGSVWQSVNGITSASDVYVQESSDDDVSYEILFAGVANGGDSYMQPQVDYDAITFNPDDNRMDVDNVRVWDELRVGDASSVSYPMTIINESGTSNLTLNIKTSPTGRPRVALGDTDDSDACHIRYDNATDALDIVVNGSEALVIDSSGNLTATGNVTAYSDARLKDDVETLDGSKVYSMRGVSFTKDGEASSGVIAQELQEVAPELVHEGEEYLSVAYGNLVGYLIEAVKGLKAEIEELREAK
jgi:chemotaxis protein histidine kinase CheA